MKFHARLARRKQPTFLQMWERKRMRNDLNSYSMNVIGLRQMHQEDPQQYASLDDLVSNDGCMDFEDDGNTE